VILKIVVGVILGNAAFAILLILFISVWYGKQGG